MGIINDGSYKGPTDHISSKHKTAELVRIDRTLSGVTPEQAIRIMADFYESTNGKYGLTITTLPEGAKEFTIVNLGNKKPIYGRVGYFREDDKQPTGNVVASIRADGADPIVVNELSDVVNSILVIK